MKMLKSFYIVCVLHAALTLAIVHAQDDQSGFISIDCGIPEGSKYTDKKTGITYVSDAGFIEGGVSGEISPEYNLGSLDLPLTTLRSFPQNTRNCYTLRPKQGKNYRYLIRLRFFYGNYDSKRQFPQFDVYLGADLWKTVYIPDPSEENFYEIIHLAASDYVHICLVNTGQGNPFVSAIEMRLLDFTLKIPRSTSLELNDRVSFGSNERIRYRDDKYDRMWNTIDMSSSSRVLQTSNTLSQGPLEIPSKVMSTAVTPINSTDPIALVWNATITTKFIIYVHFAEVEILNSNQTREFNIYLNDDLWYGPISPSTDTDTYFSTTQHTGFSSSTLPPLINAMELYRVKQFQLQQTEDQDAAAIWSIKSTYGLKRNWQGDPCIPRASLWDGVGCNYSDPQSAKIISLNLSSSRLSGEIATALANLTMIESLDLSYNNLTGDVPDFLARQDHLRIL
ncbi:hypothetical protein M8C21_031633 [Ambrosia artemisiifolia]|uniref:Malectin-like domain-containing protein n=1 Tax=Ambrosia artemisiifolia TaxID=4212 RepID=A0AAD5BQM5_AMBAR|nr:hypothetical protein M8C21_031633 [Ambrosia artemisiifolia]